MNTFTKTLTAAALATVSGIAAADDISANVTMASDYIWRGVSQTHEKPTIQGGFDYSHELSDSMSWYVGTWASNVDPQFFGGRHAPSTEMDLYTGLSGSAGEFTYDAGWLRYFYPGGTENNTTEWKLGGGWKWLGATYYYSKDWFGTGDDSSRIEGSLDFDLPYEISLSSTVGYNYGDGTKDFFNDNYTDWSIGVSKTMLGVDWGLAYTDTNVDKTDCGGDSLCDAHYVVSMSKSF